MLNRNFLNMSFPLIKHLIVAGIYLTCSCMSQQIKNNTLIYDWDEYHKMNLYCQFASTEELKRIPIQMKCYTNNKEMQHILADGTKTFPYAPDGSTVGFKLKCGNIPNGKPKSICSRYVYTNCSYSCGTSGVDHTATCNLVGPWDNVTAQWSLTEPCAVPNSMPYTSSRFPKSSPTTTEPEVEVTARSTDVSFQSKVSSVTGNASVAFSSGGTSEDMTYVIIPCVVAGCICVLLLGFLAVWFYRRRKRKTQHPSHPAHQEQCNGHSQNHVDKLEQEPSAVDDTIQQPSCVPLLEHGDGEGHPAHQEQCNGHSQNHVDKLEQEPSAVDDTIQQPPCFPLLGHGAGEGRPAHQEQCNGHSQNHVIALEQEPSAVDGTTQQPSCVPLLGQEDGEGFAELPDCRGLSDYNYAENDRYKDMGDKNPLEILEKCSKLNCESLNKIFVANMSGTVSYSKAPNGFVTDMPQTAVNISNTQNGLADLDMCNATVGLLKEQRYSYRKWLRAELEVIPGRSRERALIGYMEENERALGYMPNEIKLLEKSFETQVDLKVSDEFLHKLAAYGVKLGSIVRYFYLHGNSEAIKAILEVHRDCPFCEKFKR